MARLAIVMLNAGQDHGPKEQEESPPVLPSSPVDAVSPSERISTGAPKVSDISSFQAFAGLIGSKYQSGAYSREDATAVMTAVARVRGMDHKLGAEHVQSIIKDALPVGAIEAETDSTVRLAATDAYSPRPSIISADELQRRTYPPPVFVVPGLIVEGVTLLAGKPKLGKSWLMLDLAAAVASGGTVLGGLATSPGSVLGLFLEDSERRLQKRLCTQRSDGLSSWPVDLHLATSWHRLDQGGLSDIESWCAKVKTPRLIVIDTLAKLRSAQPSRKGAYDLDYEAVSGLHAIAHKYQVAIVVVHHTRKAEADDVFDTVSGTLGLTGAADSILVFTKKAGKALLYARGRDIEDAEIAMQFDRSCCRWTSLGEAGEVFVSDERARISAALSEATGPLSPKELMVATRIKTRNAIDLLLHKMLQEGQIVKVSRGQYLARGKIGKKDHEPKEAAKTNAETSPAANLSDLSEDPPPGTLADEKTTP